MKRYFYIFGIILFLYCNNYITAQIREKEITLEDIFSSNKFAIKSLRSVTWLKSGEAYLYLYTDTSKKQTDIWKYNVKTGSQEVFIDASKLDTQAVFRIQNYILSPDESKILFTGVLPARSVKSGGNIFLYDLKNKTFKQLTNTESEQVNIKFSPDSKYIGFVRDNNIFIIDTFTFKETQLTFDGGKHILNGKFDWVYEEEWSIIDGWSWSFDSRYIAYWQLDESQVPEFPLIDYTKTPVGIKNIRYPKAGEKNSSVKIGVIDIQKGTNQWFDLGQEEEDSYIPRIFWMPNNNKLAIFKVNRLQNKLGIFEADPMTAKTRKLLEENSETWVDVEQSNYFFLKNGSFIFTSERSGYNHIYISTFDKKIETKQITKGEYDVIKILSIDEKKGIIYFTSTEKSPLERHLYSVDFAGKKVKRITQQDGTHSINISPNFKYYIDTYSNANTVPKIILCSIDGKLIRTIEENNIPAFGEYKIGRKEFFQFKTSDNIELNGWMIKPVDFNPEKKYPVLIYVYGGPGSQTVLDQWDRNNLWYTLLTQKGYIIVSVDGRGTGARGAKFKKIVYKNLGKWETNDQIETAKYLSNLTFIDKNRIGIWGWSYGGYMALMSILLGNEIFKTAVAVAPVTDWKYYDTIYTERYMQTPELNPNGYKESSVLNYADRLKGKLLVIHGTDDDNVHWQNTISLANEFQKYNKQFLTMFYPGKDHSIAGGVTRLHLYTLMTNFIIENL